MKYIVTNDRERSKVLDIIDGLAQRAWSIEIKPHSRARTLPQNLRWQALTRLIADETGEEHERLKKQLKAKFGFYEVIELDGRKYMVLKSTTAASTEEMSNLMEQAEAFAASELGIAL